MRAAGVLLAEEAEDYDTVGFHAQQGAEKFIKAALVRHQIEFPKTHDIAVLRQLLGRVDPTLCESLAIADPLTPYGVEFWYPGDRSMTDFMFRDPPNFNEGDHPISRKGPTLFQVIPNDILRGIVIRGRVFCCL